MSGGGGGVGGAVWVEHGPQAVNWFMHAALGPLSHSCLPTATLFTLGAACRYRPPDVQRPSSSPVRRTQRS